MHEKLLRYGRRLSVGALLTMSLLQGCGEDSEPSAEACVPQTEQGCGSGQVCELVQGGEPACFAPVVIRGRVFEMGGATTVEGATLVALDVNSAARSSVVTSGQDGRYEIAVPTLRNADGTPLEDAVTLRVAASGYQSFPTAPREALPIDLTAAVADGEGPHAVENAATDVALARLPGSSGAWASVSGKIAHELASGALVVAVQGERAVSTAVADRDGAFVLFNVPAGATRVEAYRAGLRVEPLTWNAVSGQRAEDLTLQGAVDALGDVSGSVNIVNATGGLTTSVILVLESTFSESDTAVRGLTPAGLRAAEVSGAFQIEGVPPGKYAVLAAFENDELVRDPDQGIAGTDVVHIEVPSSGGPITLPESFKVTEALAITSPGATGLEMMPAGQDPVFTWVDDSSEDGYELRVFDSFGKLVHEALEVPRVTSGAVHYTWAGAELKADAIYQFRVLSWRERNNAAGRTYISATEDLRGTFQVAAPNAP